MLIMVIMVIMVTENSDTNNIAEVDSNFRENLRNQFQERETRSPSWYEMQAREQASETYEAFMAAPFVGATLRWIGGITGVILLTFGLFWLLSFFGFVLPWYSVFSVLLIISGGAFIVAAITTRRITEGNRRLQ